MIYPTFHIYSDEETAIQIIDTSVDYNPILSIQAQNNGELFLTLLRAFLNQYQQGFDDGYNCCFDEFDE